MSKIDVKLQSIIKMGFENCPNNPAMEFAKINTLVAAAIFFGTSQFVKYNRGAKKIPPPMPTAPETRPIMPPKQAFFILFCGLIFIFESVFF